MWSVRDPPDTDGKCLCSIKFLLKLANKDYKLILFLLLLLLWIAAPLPVFSAWHDSLLIRLLFALRKRITTGITPFKIPLLEKEDNWLTASSYLSLAGWRLLNC